jgi:hypothetical protein
MLCRGEKQEHIPVIYHRKEIKLKYNFVYLSHILV